MNQWKTTKELKTERRGNEKKKKAGKAQCRGTDSFQENMKE